MNPAVPTRLTFARGFTLTELAIVLLIVFLLIGGLLVPFAAQIDLQRSSDTRKTMDEIREALIGFAATTGRLPCPAADGATGVEDPNTGSGLCNTPYGGFVPGIALGLSTLDSQGYVLDAWGRRIRYAVSTANANAYTKPGGMRAQTMTGLQPDLRICSSAATMDQAGTALAKCNSDDLTNTLTNGAVAVIYSLGKNAAEGGTSTDERHNPNVIASGNPAYVAPDRAFVSHDPAPKDAPNGEFDDIVIWLSPNILYNRMIAAGQLP